MKKILIAILAIFTLTQCTPSNNDQPAGGGFSSEVTEFGIYNNATPVYAYNLDKHQTSTSAKPAYRFVMQSDDQTEYFVASISSLPNVVKTTADVEIKAVGVSGFKDGIYKMELVKITEEKAWLWSESDLLGIVVAVPIY